MVLFVVLGILATMIISIVACLLAYLLASLLVCLFACCCACWRCSRFGRCLRRQLKASSQTCPSTFTGSRSKSEVLTGFSLALSSARTLNPKTSDYTTRSQRRSQKPGTSRKQPRSPKQPQLRQQRPQELSRDKHPPRRP